ncbi:MAG: MBL fold metallo-hydrolase [Eubacteriales bacterium]
MAYINCHFYSKYLAHDTEISVVLPELWSGIPEGGYPVMYLLHGRGDDATSWVRRSSIEEYACEHRTAVVMPSAECSFYLDGVFGKRYFSYMTGELPDLFIGKEKALLFDTGYGFQDLRTEVEQITKLPLLVVNSHGHVDHALGNDQFDCPIFIHPDDIPVCEDHHGRYRKELAINYARTAVDYFTGEPVGAIGPDFNEEQYLRKGTGELVPVTEGHIFDLGDMKLEVVELPGHTPGSIGLLDRDQRILYAADAMNADFWLFMEEACPLSVYRQTLSKASGLEFDTMIISHFPAPLPKKYYPIIWMSRIMSEIKLSADCCFVQNMRKLLCRTLTCCGTSLMTDIRSILVLPAAW